MKRTGKKIVITASSIAGRLLGPSGKRRLPWIIIVVLSLIISVFLFPNILNRPKAYRIGDVAESDIKASDDILVENETLTAKNREEAVKQVPYVYDFDPSSSNLVLKLKEALADAWISIAVDMADTEELTPPEKIPTYSAEDKGLIRERFFKILEIAPDNDLFDELIRNGFSLELEENISQLVTDMFQKGIVGNKSVLMNHAQKGIIVQDIQTGEETEVIDPDRFYDIEGAAQYIDNRKEELVENGLAPETADLSTRMAILLIKPNVTFNQRETELRKDNARESVKSVYYQIKKGEMIVREGERIGQDHLVKLSAEALSAGDQAAFQRVPGMMLLIGVLFALVYTAGLVNYRSFDEDMRYDVFNAVTLLGIFVLIWAYGLIAEEVARGFHSLTTRALLFALPISCGAMLATVFQGMRIAVIFSLLISVLASLAIDESIGFFLYFFISSLSAAYWVGEYRERGILIKTGLKVGLINMVLCLSIETISGSLFTIETPVALAAAFVGGVLSGVITTGLIPLGEMGFGFTTDLKLLELANLDQPLLRELMLRAPGTYHHSVIVSNMVEATAEAINANPLLARVSAYYHDIGKVRKPLYFIENQGDTNRHEKLAPSMSSLILISHVKDGVELAREHKLGKEIIDIIRQHHGTCLISYFYQKAKEQETNNRKGKSSQIKDEDYRYPGPKPQTKEAGLVMLADMIEAATRSLADPTPARIQGTVQKIINKVFSDGQLDECELTLKDLHEIARSFNNTLSGIFHHRVEYPEIDAKHTARTDDGDTDKLLSEGPRSKKQRDTEEDRESLKRLGL
jgi:putative nucleotidyltransferase with HDIG domain